MDGLYVGIRDNLYTDGWLARIPVDTADGSVEKNAFVFTRNNNNVQKNSFKITPEKFSDYAITISNVDNNIYLDSRNEQKNFKVTVSYKSWNKTKYVELMEAPKYDGLNKTLTYNFVLDKNIEYTIDVVHSNAQPDFSVAISQNNWVYAPYGGVRTYNNYADITNYTNTETFLTDEIIVDLLYETGNRTILNWDGFLKSPDDALKTIRKSTVAGLEPWTAKIFGEVIEDGLNLSYSNTISIRTVAGGLYSATGFVLSTLIGPQVGTIFRTAKPVLFSDYVWSNTESAKLKNALNNGKYNICIRPQKSLIDSNIGVGHLMNYIEYEPWNNTRYINKYSKNIRGEVTPFETSTVIYVNGRLQEITQ